MKCRRNGRQRRPSMRLGRKIQDAWDEEKTQLHDKMHALESKLQKVKNMSTSGEGNKAMIMLKAENEALKKEMAAIQAAIDGKHAEITRKGEKEMLKWTKIVKKRAPAPKKGSHLRDSRGREKKN